METMLYGFWFVLGSVGLGPMALASGGASSATVDGFIQVATSVLTWFMTSMQTIVNFIFDNPAMLVGLGVWLVIAAIGTVRKMIN